MDVSSRTGFYLCGGRQAVRSRDFSFRGSFYLDRLGVNCLSSNGFGNTDFWSNGIGLGGTGGIVET